MTEKLLSCFQAPEQWLFQVSPGANHALWIVGHLANTDNFFLSLTAPEKCRDLTGFPAHFGLGSRPSTQLADYPAPEEVLAVFRDRRQALLGVLAELGDGDLSRATPAGAPDFLPDFAAVFETAIWHEGLHCGQITVARRALGFPPLVDAPPK